MNRFLVILFFACVRSEKLDRTYLPPPGASFAGGMPGDILAPLEIPNLPPGFNELESKTIPGSIVGPVTTTSYAFTQTTTYPSIKSYESTPVPLDPLTGLAIQNIGTPNYLGQNYPEYGQHDTQNKYNFDKNIQPVFKKEMTYTDNQYTNTMKPKFPELAKQLQDASHSGLSNLQENYVGQFSSDQQKIPSTTFLPEKINANKLPGDQYQMGPEIKSGIDKIGIYSGQPINVPDILQNQPTQGYDKPGEQYVFFSENNNYQPNRYTDGISSYVSGIPSSNFTYSEISAKYRQERPQAEADRNAVITNYENRRTPTGYSYNFDTSNGIHVDENGSIEDGTKAQGSYSYIGDDGKVYKVIYTADENGFRPRGDHLPTPPPVPEEIQRIIEKVAREKELGIVDDGSYSEEKYGHKNYQRPMSYRRPQTPQIGNVDKTVIGKEQTILKPITGLTEYDYEDEDISKFGNNEDIQKEKNRRPIDTQTSQRLLNKDDEGHINSSPVVAIKSSGYNENSSPFDELKLDESDYGQISEKQPGKVKFVKTYNQNDDFNKSDNNYIKNLTPGSYGPKQFSLKNENEIKEITTNNEDTTNNGYQYIPPEIQFEKTQFPTRFKEQQSISAKPMEHKTRRPFLTPEVYNQLSNKNEDNYSHSNTQRPLSTSSNNNDKNYDGGEDYPINPDFNSDDSNPVRESNGDIITDSVRPSEPKRTFISTQRTPPKQYKQEVAVVPGNVNGFVSSTSRPANTKLVTTETDQSKQLPDYRINMYNRIYPVYGSQGEQRTPTGVNQNYETSSQSPLTSTVLPINISRYLPNSVVSTSSYEQSPNGIYSYKYIPDQLAPGNYFPNKVENSAFGLDPVNRLPISDKTSVSMLPNLNTRTSTLAPPEYLTTYRPINLGYTTPVYSSTQSIVSPNNDGNKYLQNSDLGYIYGPPGTITSSTSKVITTPSYISSTTPGSIYQDYSTTERPGSSQPGILYDQTLVDGFGRPINIDQQPGYTYYGQNLDVQHTRPDGKTSVTVLPPAEVTPISDKKYYGTPTSIGEDFSGPKQSPTFDPRTGYYYK